MAETVYVLCALTSSACAYLLARTWLASRVPLLLYSAVCFGGLAVNNLLLFTDKVVVTGSDLSPARSISLLASLLVLVYGLVWEAR